LKKTRIVNMTEVEFVFAELYPEVEELLDAMEADHD
jgi:hypothetical protein